MDCYLPPEDRDPYHSLEPHRPRKPMWLCAVCAIPWPCGTARLNLRSEYSSGARTTLLIYLGTQYAQAMKDIYRLHPVDAPHPATLYERFLGWAAKRDIQ